MYVEDTFKHSENVQRYMDAVIATGAEYGLAINWEKVEVFGVRCFPKVQNQSGECILEKPSIQYLGALISADGGIQSELNRRLGMASADFKILDKVWTHTNVSKKQKYKIYSALIISKLLYGLQTVWLTKVQKTKLDGFNAKCIRKSLGFSTVIGVG